jgi:flagellar biosynthesis protein FliQ
VPKILAIVVCLIVLAPWMLQVLMAFAAGLLSNIPVYVR